MVTVTISIVVVKANYSAAKSTALTPLRHSSVFFHGTNEQLNIPRTHHFAIHCHCSHGTIGAIETYVTFTSRTAIVAAEK